MGYGNLALRGFPCVIFSVKTIQPKTGHNYEDRRISKKIACSGFKQKLKQKKAGQGHFQSNDRKTSDIDGIFTFYKCRKK